MIENLARVTDRQGSRVTVLAASATGCARCDAGKGCGGGVFGKLIRRGQRGLQLEDADLNLQPGQYVVIGLEDGVFLRVTLLTYGLPILALLLGAVLATGLGAGDGLGALGGLAGLGLGLWLAPRLRAYLLLERLRPRLLRRVSPAQWECSSV